MHSAIWRRDPGAARPRRCRRRRVGRVTPQLLAAVLGMVGGTWALTGSPPAAAPGPYDPERVMWRLVAVEEFQWLDPSRWTAFEGVPDCCPDTAWDPARVTVEGGVLTLANHPDEQGRWLSGGVGGWDWAAAHREHGRWDARIRFDAGEGVSATALLYPEVGWPPELNFYEIFETWPRRRDMAVTTHHGTADDHRMQQTRVEGDFTRWHEVSVRWTPSRLTYLLDGRVVRVEESPERIPVTPMWPGFQTHVHTDEDGNMPELPEGVTSVRMQVDWVRVYTMGSTLG